MVKVVKIKPAIFKEMPFPHDGFNWFELYFEDKLYGYASMDLRFPPACLLHLEIVNWSHRIFKELVTQDWPFAKKFARGLECDKIIVTKEGNLTKNASWVKLIKKCGFKEPFEFLQSVQEI